MALGDMKERILREAESKARGIENEGKQEEARILGDAKARASAILEAAKAEAKRRTDLIVTEHNAEVEIERHNALLMAKEEAIASNRDKIVEAISTGLDESYAKVVSGAVVQMNATAGIGDEEILIRADKKGMSLLKGTKYPVEETERGVWVQTRDGSVGIDISPDAMLNLNLKKIDGLISSALFEEAQPEDKPKAERHAPRRAKKAQKEG